MAPWCFHASRDKSGMPRIYVTATMDDKSTSSSLSAESENGSSPVRERGRGRPRRRSRSAGPGRSSRSRSSSRRGSGRAVRTRTAPAMPAEVQLLEDRIVHAKARIAELDERRVKELLVAVVERHPSLILDIMEPVAPCGGHHPEPGDAFPGWCCCTKCREMPTAAERICCGRKPGNCTSQIPDFDLLILNEAVLGLSRLYRQDLLAVDDEDDYNRANRHAAYRQYILWVHGRLGQGIRKVIPSCCTWLIRDKFPDAFGQYKGFIPSRIS